MFKASDGRWTQPVSIKVRLDTGDMSAFDLTYGSATVVETSTLLGGLTGASATVESIVATQQTGFIGYELFLSPNSIKNPTKAYAQAIIDLGGADPLPFMNGNTVTITLGTNTQTGTIKPVPTAITIADTVGGHSINSVLTLSGGATDVVLSVKSVNDDGTLKAINIVDSGYTIDDTQTDIKIGADVVGTITIGGITHYPGAYTDIKGFLSDQTRLRGPKPSKHFASGHTPDEYYQEFSYVIKTALSISVWGEIVKKIAHPAGYVIFGDITIRPDPALLGVLRYNQDDINTINSDTLTQITIVDDTIAITGVAGIGDVATPQITLGPEIIGVEALGQLGSLGFSFETGITGVAGVATIGSIQHIVGPDTLIGQSATGALGTVTIQVDDTEALTGVAATGQLGFITLTISAVAKTEPILTHGVAGTGAVGAVTVSIS